LGEATDILAINFLYPVKMMWALIGEEKGQKAVW
jgi:hypothetical protein